MYIVLLLCMIFKMKLSFVSLMPLNQVFSVSALFASKMMSASQIMVICD